MNVKGRKNAVSPTVCLVGLTVLFFIMLSVKKDLQASETTLGDAMKQSVAQELDDAIIHKFLPVFAYVQQSEQGEMQLLEKQIAGVMPLYGYYKETQSIESGDAVEESISLEEILREEAQDTGTEGQNDAGLPGAPETQSALEQPAAEDSLQELLQAENEAALQMLEESALAEQMPAFVRHELQNPVDLQMFRDYETLVENFYTIDGNTMAGSDQLDVTKLTGKDLTISKESDGPQILIYHTHSQETFADSVPGDESTSIVGVGAHLSEILTSEYGYEVLHHKGQYDADARDDAYGKSLPAIEQLLAENPSIQVIIDLHRDSMPEETKLVMDLDGRPTARFMFFNGLSRTRQTGNIAYLYNENQEDNLAFSFQMQLKATEYYPGLTRKIYLKGYRYNMHLRPRTTLIELGAQNNTVEEVMNACDPLAHIIDMVLSGEPE